MKKDVFVCCDECRFRHKDSYSLTLDKCSYYRNYCAIAFKPGCSAFIPKSKTEYTKVFMALVIVVLLSYISFNHIVDILNNAFR